MSTWPHTARSSWHTAHHRRSAFRTTTIIHLWRRRSCTRRALKTLDARLLADIGRTDAERHRECAKWFWQR